MFRSNDLALPCERGAGSLAVREESNTASDVIKPAPRDEPMGEGQASSHNDEIQIPDYRTQSLPLPDNGIGTSISWQDPDHPQPSNTRWAKEIAPGNTPSGEGVQPSNTRENKEIEQLKVEVTHLRQENAKLLEQVRECSQGKDLEAVSVRVLSSLKMGKQAPGYKKALSALNQFIELLRSHI